MAFWDSIVNALGSPWIDRAIGQMQADKTAYASGGVKGLLGDMGQTADLAGGFGGNIRAYHGSPYDFAKFDLSKIGTGEGAQAYGHGLYFAENPKVAEEYKNMNRGPVADAARYWLYGNNWDKAAARADMERALGTKLPDTHAAVEAINNYTPPRMYEVNINAKPEQFLNWDQPIAGQQVAKQWPTELTDQYHKYNVSGAEAYGLLGPKLVMDRAGMPGSVSNAPALRDITDKFASQALNEAGIPGIRYLDQFSRNVPQISDLTRTQSKLAALENAGKGDSAYAAQLRDWVKMNTPTSNYVVFNPEIVDILRKYGLVGALGASQLTPQGNEQ